MSTEEHNLTAQAETALREAAANLHEQLEAIDQAVAYHEERARELRATRKRVKQVEAIVSGERRNGGGGSKAAAGAQQRQHAEQRAKKKQRIQDYVMGLPADTDIVAVDVYDHFKQELPTPEERRNPANAIGRQLAVDVLRELRDDGLLRLDRNAVGGQAVYRQVARA
jgi:hypothetical protein